MLHWAYLYTFVQTCLIEFPFYYIFLRNRMSVGTLAATVLALNAITHPVVFFILMTLKLNLIIDISTAELFAFLAEAALLRRYAGCSNRRALGASLAANFMSWQFGSIATYFLFIR